MLRFLEGLTLRDIIILRGIRKPHETKRVGRGCRKAVRVGIQSFFLLPDENTDSKTFSCLVFCFNVNEHQFCTKPK